MATPPGSDSMPPPSFTGAKATKSALKKSDASVGESTDHAAANHRSGEQGHEAASEVKKARGKKSEHKDKVENAKKSPKAKAPEVESESPTPVKAKKKKRRRRSPSPVFLDSPGPASESGSSGEEESSDGSSEGDSEEEEEYDGERERFYGEDRRQRPPRPIYQYS